MCVCVCVFKSALAGTCLCTCKHLCVYAHVCVCACVCLRGAILSFYLFTVERGGGSKKSIF